MPEISRFLGIVISMYFDEHNPPHFHIRYNEYRASMSIKDLNIVVGSLPAKVRGLVEEWAEIHQEELMEMWDTEGTSDQMMTGILRSKCTQERRCKVLKYIGYSGDLAPGPERFCSTICSTLFNQSFPRNSTESNLLCNMAE